MSNDTNTKKAGPKGTFKVKLKSPGDENKLTSGPDLWMVANREPQEVTCTWSSDANAALRFTHVEGMNGVIWQVQNEDSRIRGKYLSFKPQALAFKDDFRVAEVWKVKPHLHGDVIFWTDDNGRTSYVGNEIHTRRNQGVIMLSILDDAAIVEVVNL